MLGHAFRWLSIWALSGGLAVADEGAPKSTTDRAADEKPAVAGTFSIVARDPATGELGVAVQSKIVSVGSVVPWASAGRGVIATQAQANPRYGPVGLSLLMKFEAEDVVEMLTSADTSREERQVGLIGLEGPPATYTGDACYGWAGGRVGEHYAAQGNILTGPEVVDAMSEAFEAAEGVLAERLLRALEAGQEAGGDRRGRQSAALIVVRKDWGYGGGNDRFRDLRVDDHERPIVELRRVYQLHRALFPRPDGARSPKTAGSEPGGEAVLAPTPESDPAED